jgi:hypothetical protein
LNWSAVLLKGWAAGPTTTSGSRSPHSGMLTSSFRGASRSICFLLLRRDTPIQGAGRLNFPPSCLSRPDSSAFCVTCITTQLPRDSGGLAGRHWHAYRCGRKRAGRSFLLVVRVETGNIPSDQKISQHHLRTKPSHGLPRGSAAVGKFWAHRALFQKPLVS